MIDDQVSILIYPICISIYLSYSLPTHDHTCMDNPPTSANPIRVPIYNNASSQYSTAHHKHTTYEAHRSISKWNKRYQFMYLCTHISKDHTFSWLAGWLYHSFPSFPVGLSSF